MSQEAMELLDEFLSYALPGNYDPAPFFYSEYEPEGDRQMTKMSIRKKARIAWEDGLEVEIIAHGVKAGGRHIFWLSPEGLHFAAEDIACRYEDITEIRFVDEEQRIRDEATQRFFDKIDYWDKFLTELAEPTETCANEPCEEESRLCRHDYEVIDRCVLHGDDQIEKLTAENAELTEEIDELDRAEEVRERSDADTIIGQDKRIQELTAENAELKRSMGEPVLELADRAADVCQYAIEPGALSDAICELAKVLRKLGLLHSQQAPVVVEGSAFIKSGWESQEGITLTVVEENDEPHDIAKERWEVERDRRNIDITMVVCPDEESIFEPGLFSQVAATDKQVALAAAAAPELADKMRELLDSITGIIEDTRGSSMCVRAYKKASECASLLRKLSVLNVSLLYEGDE